MRKHALPVLATAVLVAALIAGVDTVSQARSADPVATAARPVTGPPLPAPVVESSLVKKANPWEVLTSQGLPRPLSVRGWGDRPSTSSGIGWEKWSYPRFPIACSPATSELPAYQVIWATNASRPRTDTVLDTAPELVWETFRRVASVFAASNNAAIRTQDDLEHALTPRFVTTETKDGCRPAIERAQVPAEVLAREDIQNWVNPATGRREQGLWAYLESHGYPARNDRRYVVIVDDVRAADHRSNGMKGHAVIPANTGGYAATDLSPGPQNRNNAGGTWLTVFTDGRREDFRAGGGEFGPALAHELTHTLGAALEGSPHYNAQSYGHPSDCADLLCYNNYEQAGQHYTACSAAQNDSYRAFWAAWGSESKAAVRLDCNRDDYFARYADGSGEKPWADERWSASRNAFLWGNQERPPYAGEPFTNPNIPPSCLYLAGGYCPPGVKTGGLVEQRTLPWVTVH